MIKRADIINKTKTINFSFESRVKFFKKGIFNLYPLNFSCILFIIGLYYIIYCYIIYFISYFFVYISCFISSLVLHFSSYKASFYFYLIEMCPLYFSHFFFFHLSDFLLLLLLVEMYSLLDLLLFLILLYHYYLYNPFLKKSSSVSRAVSVLVRFQLRMLPTKPDATSALCLDHGMGMPYVAPASRS